MPQKERDAIMGEFRRAPRPPHSLSTCAGCTCLPGDAYHWGGIVLLTRLLSSSPPALLSRAGGRKHGVIIADAVLFGISDSANMNFNLNLNLNLDLSWLSGPQERRDPGAHHHGRVGTRPGRAAGAEVSLPPVRLQRPCWGDLPPWSTRARATVPS